MVIKRASALFFMFKEFNLHYFHLILYIAEENQMTKSEFLQLLEKEKAFLPNNKMSAAITNKIKKHHPDWLAFIEETWPGKSISEALHLLKNNREPGVCGICGKPTKFISFGEGYKAACSRECANKLKGLNSKKTSLERYGKIGFQTEKYKKTIKEKYGVDNAGQIKKQVDTSTAKLISKEEFDKKINHAFLPNNKLDAGVVKLIKNNAELLKYIETHYLNKGISEALYLYRGLPVTVCEECGNSTLFKSFGEGYKRFCSNECAKIAGKRKQREVLVGKYDGIGAQSPIIREKMRQTTLKKYGVENVFQSKPLQQRIKESLNEKYNGVGFGSELIREKIKQTTLRNYGVENPLKSPEIQEKLRQTNLEKYGVEYAWHSKEIQEKMARERNGTYYDTVILDKFKDSVIPLFSKEEFKGLSHITDRISKTSGSSLRDPIEYKWKCVTCGTKYMEVIRSGEPPRCPKCKPTLRGVQEAEMFEWLIEEFPELKLHTNTRKIISPLELDFYFPEKSFAIEFNELYWHSESIGRGRDYHINKTQQCQEKDIHLIHIWDYEWRYQQEIIKSIIRSKLGRYRYKLNARDCRVDFIQDVGQARDFFDTNHIQGYTPARTKLGLFDKDDRLVSAILIGPNRFKRDTYEILRFASLLNTAVRGGFSKLMSVVSLKGKIRSYADLRLFSGSVNTSSGFELVAVNPPSYHYTRTYDILENRQSYQKKLIKKKFPEIYNDVLTEWEMMQLLGFDRLWDCGTATYEKDL
jgi:DNA-directed RNA polymerase subunit RPC12/RpoP